MAKIEGGAAFEEALGRIGDRLSAASLVRVGFLEGATYPDGTSVATIAAIQNFGAPEAGIPAHPFFSKMIAEKSAAWPAKFLKVLKAANYDVERALELMGQGIVGQLRDAIVDMDSPALSKVTLLLRQRFSDHVDITFADVQQARRDIAAGVEPDVTGTQAKPLVWTGQMLASVDSEVE